MNLNFIWHHWNAVNKSFLISIYSESSEILSWYILIRIDFYIILLPIVATSHRISNISYLFVVITSAPEIVPFLSTSGDCPSHFYKIKYLLFAKKKFFFLSHSTSLLCEQFFYTCNPSIKIYLVFWITIFLLLFWYTNW